MSHGDASDTHSQVGGGSASTAPAVVHYTTRLADFMNFVRKNAGRSLVAAVSVDGVDVGLVGSQVTTIGVAVGDATSFTSDDGDEAAATATNSDLIGRLELLASIDVSRMSPSVFKMSGLHEFFTSNNIVKILFDSRLPAVALGSRFQIRPSPVADMQLGDIVFRAETRDTQMRRLRRCFHWQVFQSPALQTALGHCVRLNSLEEALQEHALPTPSKLVVEAAPSCKDEVSLTARRAVSIFYLYRLLRCQKRISHAKVWGELIRWSAEYVAFYKDLHEPEERQRDNAGNTLRMAPTREGIDRVFYHTHSVLPLSIVPRRAALGDGTQFQVGRLLTVDQHSRVCRGCQRRIGPLTDTFDHTSQYCYVCEVLNWSFRYRREGKQKPDKALRQLEETDHDETTSEKRSTKRKRSEKTSATSLK